MILIQQKGLVFRIYKECIKFFRKSQLGKVSKRHKQAFYRKGKLSGQKYEKECLSSLIFSLILRCNLKLKSLTTPCVVDVGQ